MEEAARRRRRRLAHLRYLRIKYGHGTLADAILLLHRNGPVPAALLPDGSHPKPRHAPPTTTLTAVERDILQLLATGLHAHQVAQARGTGHETVRTQIKSARQKLQATNATHAVAKAWRQGLID